MRIPEPKKLPSGKWYMQIMVDKVRHSRAFDTREDAIYWASGLKTKSAQDARSPRQLTVGEAIDRYIESKSSVLSPSTIAGYKRIRKNQLQGLMGVQVRNLTQEQVQREINQMARKSSPKTVRNAHGLLTATLSVSAPDLNLRTTLPQKRRPEIVIPSGEDLKAILTAVHGKSVELPVLLAAWLGLRMSEIRGLTWDCIKGDTIHIKQAMVDEGLKGTKTYSSDRVLPLPAQIKALLDAKPHKGEFIFPESRRAIASRFDYYTKKAGLPHYRFHDLRHYNASVMLALGIPDKYAMQRMGHATNNMLKTVYQHTMQDEEKKNSEKIDAYFAALLSSQEG